MIRGTASGKVILFGEHAVVHGVPALAVGIDRGATAAATPVTEGPSTLTVREWNVTVRDDGVDTAPLARSLRDLIEVTRAEQRAAGEPPVGSMHVEAAAELPPGGGLGCSAAIGVAVARALDPSASADVIAARVMAWERVFHGNPSGVDAAVSARGGCVQFQRGAAVPIERVRLTTPLQLCIGHTGIASSTKTMVDGVASLLERKPETTRKTFDAIHTVVKNARLAIEAGDTRAIGQLLDLNQMLLSGLFVSTPEIEQLCATARTAGALGAKLTGAGGGGCVVALVDDATHAQAVLAAWKKDGFDGFCATVGDGPRAVSMGKGAVTSPAESAP
ncbi:MAG: mevalonate kinase [Deltaproteobacteria bacterium]|nr:mevalonate kinase [Deltaproteobacteria bacterium]